MHYTSYGESESLPPEQYVLWGMMERSKSRYISNIFCLKMHSYLAVICLAASSAALTCSCAPGYFPYAVRASSRPGDIPSLSLCGYWRGRTLRRATRSASCGHSS